MPAGQQSVPQVCGCENERTANREKTVGNQTEVAMGYGRANDEQAEPRNGGHYDARVVVSRIADADCDDAEWGGEIQHLRVQVAFGERHQHRQGAHEKWQREAVQQAQAGKPDRCAIEPVRRFRGCLIHRGMPLCWRGAQAGAAEMK